VPLIFRAIQKAVGDFLFSELYEIATHVTRKNYLAIFPQWFGENCTLVAFKLWEGQQWMRASHKPVNKTVVKKLGQVESYKPMFWRHLLRFADSVVLDEDETCETTLAWNGTETWNLARLNKNMVAWPRNGEKWSTSQQVGPSSKRLLPFQMGNFSPEIEIPHWEKIFA
jgi:hypothetical protein